MDLQRQKELVDADAASRKNYQLVISEYKTQEVVVRSLGEKLRIIHLDPEKLTVTNLSGKVAIYSPIDGFVSKVNVNIGKYTNPSDVLFELVNPSDIHAAMTVFENDISFFKKGIKGKVALLNKPGDWYEVETILVTRNINESRSGLIHCHFEKANKEVLPGMFLTGIFETGSQRVMAVPEEAVVRYMGKEFIFISKGGMEYRLLSVETGAREKGWIELKSPAANGYAGAEIVVKGAYSLLGKLKNKMEDN